MPVPALTATSQVVNLPDLTIVDFSYGHVGSTHDATAWRDTRLMNEQETLMEAGEFIWADSAYPVSSYTFTSIRQIAITNSCIQISNFVVAPYKSPARDIGDNDIFNNHVSMVRIRSEHAIGFLKGRFQSLKNLRVTINNASTHKIATYWIAACIGLHAFAMQCEKDEYGDDIDFTVDPFVREGLDDNELSDSDSPQPPLQSARATRLQVGKEFRERLKAALFRSKARRAARRTRVRHEELGIEVDD